MMTVYFRFLSVCGLRGNMGTCCFASQADSLMERKEDFHAGGKRLSICVDQPQSATSQTDGPGCAERTTSTTEGHIGGGETSETPSSSNNTSEERQEDKSAENAFTAAVQVSSETQTPPSSNNTSEEPQVEVESSLGSDALASKQVHVTVASEAINWKNVVNKQLLTGLAENPRLKLTGFVTGLTPEQKSYARSLGIELVDTDERDELYDFSNSELLSYPPESLKIDIFLIHSYESGLGKQAQLVRKHRRNCKWVQVVHTISEELLSFLESPEEYKDEHKRKIGLCEKADLVIAVGPKVYEAYKRALSASRNDEKLIPFVPGIIKELSNICQVHENSNFENFVVLVSGSSIHFKVKGFDIAAKAFSSLEKSYHRPSPPSG